MAKLARLLPTDGVKGDIEMELVAWLLFALTTAVVAGSRGLDWFVWGFLGLLLGPFATIMAFAAPKNEKKLEAALLASGGYQRCPACVAVIPIEAVRCRYCFGHLPAQSPTTAEGQKPPPG